MNVKLVLTDLDYTLLRSDGSISEYTKQIFKKCQNCGLLIVIATARYWIGAELPVSEIAVKIADRNHCHLQSYRGENWYAFLPEKSGKIQAILAVSFG